VSENESPWTICGLRREEWLRVVDTEMGVDWFE
jgi:hypothetical protein